MVPQHLKEKIIFSFVILVGLFFVFLVPPFQKPDETVHYWRAVALSKGQFFCTKGDDTTGYFSIPNANYKLPSFLTTSETAFRYNTKFPLYLLTQVPQIESKETPYQLKGYCGLLSFMGYIPNATGLLISAPLNNLLLSFYFGRLAALLFFLSCFYFSLKIIRPEYKNILYFFGVVPMALHQATAYSYDSAQLSLVFIIFTLLINILNKSVLRILDLVFLLLAILVFVLIKPGYYAFLLLPLLIPLPKLGKVFLKNLWLFVGLFLFSFLILIFFINQFQLGPLPYPPHVLPNFQLDFIIQHPLKAILILYNTLGISGEAYYKGLIGIFGWLDYSVNFFVYIIYSLTFGLIVQNVINQTHKTTLNTKKLFLLFLVICATFISIFLLMYLNHTPVASSPILGVQGRYFLVLIPFIIYFITQFFHSIGKLNFIFLIVILSFIFIVGNVLISIYLRYYDYSSVNITQQTKPLG